LQHSKPKNARRSFSSLQRPPRACFVPADRRHELRARHGWAPNRAHYEEEIMAMKRLDLEEISDVTVARFVDKKILDESNIQTIGNELFALVDTDGRQKIIVDFSNVEYFSSAALGKLITLDKKVKTAKGRLRLCSIRPDIYEVFQITKLNKLFDIRENREQALAGLC
jgi:anti-sigma B factor antagonist